MKFHEDSFFPGLPFLPKVDDRILNPVLAIQVYICIYTNILDNVCQLFCIYNSSGVEYSVILKWKL